MDSRIVPFAWANNQNDQQHNDELEILAERLDAGATQLEIAAALSDRPWEAVRK